MNIIGIETSCDDTAVSIVKGWGKNFKILSNIISSQVKLHAKYGGVYPSLAKREHLKNLPVVFKKAFQKSPDKHIDLISVTAGPGLEPCLWTGVNFAKELAGKWKVPIVPVNHIEAHILAIFLLSADKTSNSKFPISSRNIFPAICLVVSGGHTQLILMRDFGSYRIVGETRDDAAGECFDKTARILGLTYPGGPVIAVKAAKHKARKNKDLLSVNLPRPMMHQKNYDFSFSGLKTAVLYDFKNRTKKTRKSKKYIRKMCHEIQQAIIDVLTHKTLKAARDFKARTIILGGGVAANNELRRQLKLKIKDYKLKIAFFIPPKNLCTDNAAMVAITGYFNRKKTKHWKEIKANANLRINSLY